MRVLGASPFQPSLPPTSLSISVPQPLGLRHSRSFLKSAWAFLSFLWGHIGAWKSPKNHHEAKLPQSPRTWMDGPISSSIRLFPAHPGPPHFHTFPSHLYKRTCLLPLLSIPLLLPHFSQALSLLVQGRVILWCFFISGPSSLFVFGVSPLPDTSFSPSLDPRAQESGLTGSGPSI